MSQKKVHDKMIRPGQIKDKGAHVGDEVLLPSIPDGTYICVKECNVPGVGTWKSGDTISDEETILKVKGSPYFQPVAKIQEGG